MNIGNEIKKLAIDNATTITQLAKSIEEYKQRPYSVQNLSTKLKRGTVNLNELHVIMDTLGYKIKFEKNNLT